LRAAYIGAVGERQAIRRMPARPAATGSMDYDDFTKISLPESRVPVSFNLAQIGCNRPDASSLGGVDGKNLIDGAIGAEPEETTMLRKLSLVAVAGASLAATALAPTSASAWGGWHGGWHGGGWHRGWVGPRFYVGGPAYYGYGGCYVRRLVPTPWGPRWRLVNRCY
jgi:hypothetical protein